MCIRKVWSVNRRFLLYSRMRVAMVSHVYSFSKALRAAFEWATVSCSFVLSRFCWFRMNSFRAVSPPQMRVLLRFVISLDYRKILCYCVRVPSRLHVLLRRKVLLIEVKVWFWFHELSMKLHLSIIHLQQREVLGLQLLILKVLLVLNIRRDLGNR